MATKGVVGMRHKDTRICFDCGKEFNDRLTICPHCGCNMYGDNGEYAPTEEEKRQACMLLGYDYDKLLNAPKKSFWHKRKERKAAKCRGFSDEEILALGLYPDDEAYRMSLITKIINK